MDKVVSASDYYSLGVPVFQALRAGYPYCPSSRWKHQRGDCSGGDADFPLGTILSRGIKTQMQLDSRIATQLFWRVCSAITLFFIITYGLALI